VKYHAWHITLLILFIAAVPTIRAWDMNRCGSVLVPRPRSQVPILRHGREGAIDKAGHVPIHNRVDLGVRWASVGPGRLGCAWRVAARSVAFGPPWNKSGAAVAEIAASPASGHVGRHRFSGRPEASLQVVAWKTAIPRCNA
jgi:hypothetical protein